MAIRKATAADLPDILGIYSHAREFMAASGNASQWGTAYPSESLVRGDIADGNLYVIEDLSGIHAVFAFILGKDKTYDVIKDGAWLSGSEYGTLHRVASDGKMHGVLTAAVKFCEGVIRHLRIDTHADNAVMQRQILKNGFSRCGIIYAEDKTERIAFEKLC